MIGPRALALLTSMFVSGCLGASSSIPARAPSPREQLAPAPVIAEVTPALPEQSPLDSPREITIGASGDVLVHIKVTESARAHDEGFRWLFAELGTIVRDEDVAFLNLETPLSLRIPPETGDPPILGAPAEVADGLRAGGIDVVSVANNHSYDQTADGLADTLAALAAAEVTAVGADADPSRAAGPAVVVRNGVRAAFVAYTERVNRGPVARGAYTRVARFDLEEACARLRASREVADVVVLSIHWSHDFYASPSVSQREQARLLADAGADLILGHGPHVLQEVERLSTPRGEAIVAYSLGNLVSNQGLRYFPGRRIPEDLHPAVVLPTTRDGLWLRTRFRLGEGGRVEVAAVTGVPLWTENNFLRVAERIDPRLEIRVRPLHTAEAAVQAERRDIIAHAIGDAVTLVDE